MLNRFRLLGGASLALAAQSIARRWYAHADNARAADASGLTAAERSLAGRVLQSEAIDRLNRQHPHQIEPERHVVVVVGITGAGKSSTANTFRGGRWHSFAVSDSIVSVTKSTSYKDFSPVPSGPFSKVQFRIIDTPGLMDTNRSASDINDEFVTLKQLAPHGVSAFLVCVPMGRVTDEHERAIKGIVELWGADVIQHSAVVVTNSVDAHRSLLHRDQLIDKISALPPRHFLRSFVEGSGWRLVAVDNVFEPARSISSLRLQQAVLDTVAANGGRRYQWSSAPEQLAPAPAVDGAEAFGRVQSVTVSTNAQNKRIITIVCELPDT
jgi:hypothetical protein